ncbi:MAG: response regulator [Verrucomicrobia subdivision 3 bacterium]|nr:response regulator [Limisphaerales bacterium]
METSAAEPASSSFAGTILLVDDRDAFRLMTVELLSSFGFTVESVRSAEAALLLFDPSTHDVVVTDNSMPGMSGAELAHIIKLRSPSTPVLMYTASPPEDSSCLDLVIQKPAPVQALKHGVEKLLTETRS